VQIFLAAAIGAADVPPADDFKKFIFSPTHFSLATIGSEKDALSQISGTGAANRDV
jgi:hypothetical protein